MTPTFDGRTDKKPGRILIFSFLLSWHATAATYFVDALPGMNCAGGAGTSYRTTQRDCAGSDGTKSWTAPQGPVEVLAAGDVVFIRSGIYTASGSNHVLLATVSGTSTSPINWRAYDGETPVFRAITSGDGGFGIYVVGHFNRFSGIKIESGRGGIVSAAVGTEFMDGEVTGTYGTGVYFDGCRDCALRRSKVYHTNLINWPRGAVYSAGGTWGAGVTAQGPATANFVAEDNFIYWNHGEGLSCGVGSQNCVFRRNVVADNWAVGIYVDGAKGVTVDSNLVYLTDTAKNWAVPQGGNQSNSCGICMAIEPDSASATGGFLENISVTNNVVVNTNGGIQAFRSGVMGTTWRNWVIANNTFIGNNTGIVMGNVGGTITLLTVRNNIFTKENYAQMNFDPLPSNSTFSHNIFNTTSNGTSPYFYFSLVAKTLAEAISILGMTNTSVASPQLVNEAASLPRLWNDPSLPPAPSLSLFTRVDLAADFNLSPSSPAIDQGTDLLSLGLAGDFNGSRRPQGAGSDIGAFEFGGESDPPGDTSAPTISITSPAEGSVVNRLP